METYRRIPCRRVLSHVLRWHDDDLPKLKALTFSINSSQMYLMAIFAKQVSELCTINIGIMNTVVRANIRLQRTNFKVPAKIHKSMGEKIPNTTNSGITKNRLLPMKN